MENIKVYKFTQEVTVDLNKIIEYHPASKIYISDTNDNTQYKTTVETIAVLKESEVEIIINDNYKYSEIADKTLPNPSHKYNLMVLVKHLIEFEWNYYNSYTKINKEDEEEEFFNQHELILKILDELNILYEFIENDNHFRLATKIQLKEIKSFGKINKSYDVQGKQIITDNPIENKQIIDTLIENRKIELKGYYQTYFPLFKFENIKWNQSGIKELTKYIIQPFRDFRALWLFDKLVSEKILNYLKSEMEWNQGDVTITQEQGVIIYTLLAIFHLIDSKVELQHLEKRINDRDKAKYVRSFFRGDLKDANEMFYDITRIR